MELTRGDLLLLYGNMVRSRKFDEKTVLHGLPPSSAGQETVSECRCIGVSVLHPGE